MNKDLEKSYGFNRKSLKMTCRAIELDGTQEVEDLAILQAEKDLLALLEKRLATPALPVPAASAVPAAIDGSGLVV